MKKNIKAVIFDVDGVLIDSEDLWYEIFKGLQRMYGQKTWRKDQFREHAGEFFSVFTKGQRQARAQEMEEEMGRYVLLNYFRFFEKIKIFPETKTVLANLRLGGIKLALATNTDHRLSLPTLRKFKLEKYFSTMVFRKDVRHYKPAPDMPRLALRRLGVKREEVIYVGDSIADQGSAGSAGIFFVGLGIPGDRQIKRIGEVPGVIKELSKNSLRC